MGSFSCENSISKFEKKSSDITGVNFKNQKVEDGFYKEIEPLIVKEKNGKEFINIINNGFFV